MTATASAVRVERDGHADTGWSHAAHAARVVPLSEIIAQEAARAAAEEVEPEVLMQIAALEAREAEHAAQQQAQRGGRRGGARARGRPTEARVRGRGGTTLR